jgi:hypothetical protein
MTPWPTARFDEAEHWHPWMVDGQVGAAAGSAVVVCFLRARVVKYTLLCVFHRGGASPYRTTQGLESYSTAAPRRQVGGYCTIYDTPKNFTWATGAPLRLAAGEPVIKDKPRTTHREALIVRGTGYNVDHLDQPRASLSLSADIHQNVLTHSHDRMVVSLSTFSGDGQ